MNLHTQGELGGCWDSAGSWLRSLPFLPFDGLPSLPLSSLLPASPIPSLSLGLFFSLLSPPSLSSSCFSLFTFLLSLFLLPSPLPSPVCPPFFPSMSGSPPLCPPRLFSDPTWAVGSSLLATHSAQAVPACLFTHYLLWHHKHPLHSGNKWHHPTVWEEIWVGRGVVTYPRSHRVQILDFFHCTLSSPWNLCCPQWCTSAPTQISRVNYYRRMRVSPLLGDWVLAALPSHHGQDLHHCPTRVVSNSDRVAWPLGAIFDVEVPRTSLTVLTGRTRLCCAIGDCTSGILHKGTWAEGEWSQPLFSVWEWME